MMSKTEIKQFVNSPLFRAYHIKRGGTIETLKNFQVHVMQDLCNNPNAQTIVKQIVSAMAKHTNGIVS